MIYLDLETHLITRGALAPRPVCAQWSDPEPRVELWKDLPAEILDGEVAGANIAYDMAVMLAAGVPPQTIFAAYDEGRVTDLQLDGKLLDIAAGEYSFRSVRGWSLQELARRAGVRIDKDEDDETGDGSWRLRFGQLDGIPVEHWPAGARRYALAEVPAMEAVHEAQQAARRAWQVQGLDPLGYHSQHAASSAFALHLVSCQGVLTDPERVETLAARVNRYLDATRRRLQRVGFVRADGTRDTVRAARALVDACAKAGRDVERTDGAAKGELQDREKLQALEAAAEGYAHAIVDGVRKLDATKDPARRRELQAHLRALPLSLTEKRRLCKLAAKWHGDVYLPGVKVDRDQAILSGSRVMELYADYTGADLLRGRVERMRQGYTLPLQSRFDPLKETARTSSTQPGDPLIGEQMQNFPRQSGATPAEKRREREGEFFVGLRECFRPRAGHVFIGADYSSAELHTVAQLCLTLFGHSKLAALLNEGTDVHWWLAAVTLGRPLEEIQGRDEYKTDRQRAKPGNFGFWGGMGPEKFVLYSRKGYGVRYTIPEAKDFKRQWSGALPETRDYFAWINRLLGDRGTFTHVHPITGYVRGGCYYTSGANHGFQHLAAYGAKDALYEVTKAAFRKSSPLYGCRPWNFVHDEILCEAPREQAPEAAEELARIMNETFNQFVPDVPCRAEPWVAGLWSKSIKTTRDPHGRLVPWRP